MSLLCCIDDPIESGHNIQSDIFKGLNRFSYNRMENLTKFADI